MIDYVLELLMKYEHTVRFACLVPNGPLVFLVSCSVTVSVFVCTHHMDVITGWRLYWYQRSVYYTPSLAILGRQADCIIHLLLINVSMLQIL